MFRFAWAYQNSGSGGSPTPFPIQTVSAQAGQSSPLVNVNNSTAPVRVRSYMPVTEIGSGPSQLFVRK